MRVRWLRFLLPMKATPSARSGRWLAAENEAVELVDTLRRVRGGGPAGGCRLVVRRMGCEQIGLAADSGFVRYWAVLIGAGEIEGAWFRAVLAVDKP